jgi:hypothetical protein
MELLGKERVFEVDCVGEITGKRYEGKFTVLCSLNIGQKHALALEKTRLLGNYPSPTEDLIGLATLLATLRTKITDGPEWWKQSRGGSTLEDEEVVVVIYEKIQEAERAWREDLKQKAQKAQEI